MSRKTNIILANSLIALSSVVGGLAAANHFAAAASPALTSAANSSSSTSNTSSTSNNASQSSTAAAKSGTATSTSVAYQYGQVQLTVTETNGKITNIDTGTSSATGGREQAFSSLVQQAIASQGTGFSNLSGATFTSEAFKQALSSALSKLA